ncbi:3-deoxy-7-phosphoheptulonate synthase [Saccharothrix sp. Mg75]|uniref:3-deoxy-7-phosphoheptulonate synthase n=1 Tax=Saccharothrix sp. Mg75 TaxID=3445357 RepID=UPI003EEF2604
MRDQGTLVDLPDRDAPGFPGVSAALAKPAARQPRWSDDEHARSVHDMPASAPPVVPAAEVDRLGAHLARVARGEAFLLQGEDRAEAPDPGAGDPGAGDPEARVTANLRTLAQAALVLTYASGLPVVQVGRFAGRHAGPRPPLADPAGQAADRSPDPARMARTYLDACSTTTLVRDLTRSGFADLARVNEWNREFVRTSRWGVRYGALADEVDAGLGFVRACRVDTGALRGAEVHTSHEALVLDYERAMLRTGTGLYDLSGHFLWIGERTARPDGAHIAFVELLANPIGVGIGPTATPDLVAEYVARLDPRFRAGRVTLMVGMGSDRVRTALPPIVEAVTASGHDVVWQCDPLRRNAPGASRFDRVVDEVQGFFEVHRRLGTHPGGIHVELTGATDRGGDPDTPQALDLAFLTGEVLMG